MIARLFHNHIIFTLILLLVCGIFIGGACASTTENRITNGDFSTSTGWYATSDAGIYAFGNGYGWADSAVTSSSSSDNQYIYQSNVDLTGVSTLSFKYLITLDSLSDNAGTFYVKIGNTDIYTAQPTSTSSSYVTKSVTIPAALRTSGQTIYFGARSSTMSYQTRASCSMQVDDVAANVVIYDPPTVNSITCRNELSQFSNSPIEIAFTAGDFPSGGTAKLIIDFGDGSTPAEQVITSSSTSPVTVTHKYPTSSSVKYYTITAKGSITVSGITRYQTTPVEKRIIVPINPLPPVITGIEVSTTNPTIGVPTEFAVSFEPGEYVSGWKSLIKMNFGDAGGYTDIVLSSTDTSPKTVSHTYSSQDRYYVFAVGAVAVNDDSMHYMDDTFKDVYVTVSIPKPSGYAKIITSSASETAITSAVAGQTVYINPSITFSESLTTDTLSLYENNVLKWTKTYNEISQYIEYTVPNSPGSSVSLKLVATNSVGSTDIPFKPNDVTPFTLSITAIPTPTITGLTINSESYTGDIPFLVNFVVLYNDPVSNPISRFNWDFGDGTNATQTTGFGSYAHTYTVAGNYTVTVSATNNGGTSNVYTLARTINATQPGVTPTPTPASGSGGAYASTFATIYVLNKADGTPIPNIKVTGSATAATAASWIGDLFGQIWGDRVVGSEVSGYTDAQGAITFPVFTSVKYYITITDVNNTVTQQPNRLDKDKYEYSFTPSALTTPYQYYVNLANTPIVVNTNNIETSVQVSNSNGQITVLYNDPTQYTTRITFDTYLKDTSTGNWTRQGYLSTDITGSSLNVTMQIQSYSGKDFMFVLVGESPYFEPVERTYYKTFSGPRLSFGIPDSMYIWICFITALILGGVATYLSSPATCFLIVFVEWIYWFFGWLFAIDDLLVPGASAGLLVFATIMSIAYYISSRK